MSNPLPNLNTINFLIDRYPFHIPSIDKYTPFAYLKGAIHSTKISRNFGPKLNGSVPSNQKSVEKSGPPFEVDHVSRSDQSEFWLNGLGP